MSNKLLFRLAVLVAAIMSALGAEAIEAYACYTRSNYTLTFYYDNLRNSRQGTTYDLNSGYNAPGWDCGVDEEMFCAIQRVVFDPSFANARPTSTYHWFYEQYYIMSITGLREYLNTSEVTNMAYMFFHCGDEFLKSIDLSGFNTEKVTDMRGMFSYTKLTSLDLSSFNTSKVTNMEGMFSRPYDLTTIYVSSKWSTASVTSSSNMFKNCTSLVGGMGTAYDEDHLDVAYAHIDGGTSNPGYLSDITTLEPEAYAVYTSDNTTLTFYYDNRRAFRSGTTYDMNEGENAPGWCGEETTYNTDITRVIFDPSFADARPTSTYEWFGAMFNIDHIEGLNYLNTSEVTTMKYMFSDCYGVLTADLSNFDTRKVTDMTAMFAYCLAEELDLSSFSTENVTNMLGMFAYCSSLKIIYVGDSWSTAAVTSSTNMFLDCTSLVGGMGTTYDANHIDASYAHIDGGTSNPGYMSEHQIEAYACYTPSNTTLTFYYDNQRGSRPGTTYDLNTGNNPPAWYNDRIYSSVTRVVFDPSFADARPTSTCEWFILMDKLQSITGMEYLNTSEVTYMLEMFGGCTQFTTLDLSSFNTSKVTSMRGMFDYCIGLTSLNLSNFDTSNVTDMSMMFSSCSNLTSLDVTHFNTANVTNMSSMFHHCTELTEIDVSHFNTANVTSTHNMFNSCSGLTTLDLSSFNTAKVEYMNYMFYNCSNLTSIYVGSGWSTAAVTLSDGMFDDCTRIRGGQGTTYDANHVDATYAHIDGGPSNPGYFTENPKEAYACYTPNNTTLTFYYDTQRDTRPGITYDLNTGRNQPEWINDEIYESVNRVVFEPSFAAARPVSTYMWFYCMENVQSIEGIEYLNTSEVTNMGAMFMACSGLTNLDVSHFNTDKATDMFHMFYGCSNLTSLDVRSFNTTLVGDMRGMFRECSKLTSLDLSSFNTANVEIMSMMFKGDSHLTTIYVGDDWSTAILIYSIEMFSGCTSLVGGQGTTYDVNHLDVSYAHIDGGPSNPGYFSEKGPEPYACFTEGNTTLTFYYDNQRSSRTGTTYDLNTGDNTPGWKTDGTYTNVTKVVFDPSFADARPTTTYRWLYDMRALRSISGIEYLNTSEVTDMGGMFYNCYRLTGLDLSNFNTSNVIDMQEMFFGCNGLTSLDLSSFNTANVTNMYFMFVACIGLTELDLSSFNTASVTNMQEMFLACFNLTTIYVGSGWSTTAVTSSSGMFTDCNSLVGGQGTTYDANHIDASYAHIDGGTSNPGYFTEKVDFIRGDVNGDNLVNISDVTALIDYLLSGNVSGINVNAADCNQDSSVNISDVTSLIDYLLSGTWN